MIKKNKDIIIFMPFIGIGGVEKNLFIISNYLAKKVKNISICTSSKFYKKKFHKNIHFISPRIQILKNFNIRIKYFICLFLLLKTFLKRRNFVVISSKYLLYFAL